MHVLNSVRVKAAVALAALALILSMGVVVVQTAAAPPAAAHGAVTDPPSRAYGCFDRWAANWQSPAMATADPMCDYSWKQNPNAMWNWNGQLRDGLGGNYQGAVPDGQLCSAGNSMFNAMNTPGNWVAKGVPSNFKLTLTDGSDHGADFLRIYVSKPGFDPTTQRLGWGNLDLVTQTGYYPASDPYIADINLSGRSGRAVLFTIWQASHNDQTYMFCSDINIGGGNIGPWPGGGTSTPPVSTPPVSTPPTSTSPSPVTGDCTATLKVVNSWSGGFQGEVAVKAGASAIRGWKVTVGGATITQAWNSTLSGGSTLTNASYNGSLAAGASTTAGFIANGSSSGLTATCSAV